MELAIYQILTPLLSLIMIMRTISFFRRDKRTFREVLVNTFFWGCMIAISIFPNFFVSFIEQYTGLKSGVTGILFLAVLILGLLVIHLLHENEKRTVEITKIVRHLAINEKEKNES